MRLDFRDERVLAVIAHPDDAELLCAGTLARAREDGAAIALAVLCSGDKGQPAKAVKNLASVRAKEMAAAAKLLGAELHMMGVGDGELVDDYGHRRKLIEMLRKFRPTLVLAHDPKDYHADHRAASALAEAAAWFAASAGHKTASKPLSGPPAMWYMDTVEMLAFEPGFFIEIGGKVELKRRMLACHKSQLARGSERNFSPLETIMLRQCATRGAQAGVEAAEAFRIHGAWKRLRAW